MDYNSKINIMKQHTSLFLEGQFGLEKENLRVTNKGMLSETTHPLDPSDGYTEQIIKDFAESQLELVTKPHESIEDAFAELMELQDFMTKDKKVKLWPFSMPCRIEDEESIIIAKYDESTKEGFEASTYRKELAKKHGKKMQLISGIHYNFSFSDRLVNKLAMDRNTLYFHVARNLIRNQWLFTYLFGASPNVDRTYKEDVVNSLLKIENCCDCCDRAHTYYEEYATSLRMSRYGYHSGNQKDLHVSYDNLGSYIESIAKGIDSKLLEKESEYYAPIRFKQSKYNKSSMLQGLDHMGVEYIELRMFDLNPYEHYGMNMNMLYFTHMMIIYALLSDSPKLSTSEMDRHYENNQRAAIFGRMKSTKFKTEEGTTLLKDIGETTINEIMALAIILDDGNMNGPYVNSVADAKEKLKNPEKLVSAKIMNEILSENKSFYYMGVKRIIRHKKLEFKEITV